MECRITHLTSSGEFFVAEVARIGLLARVEAHVEPQALLEGE